MFINYLEAAVPEDRFRKLQDKIGEILNKGQDKMSRLLEGVLKDIIDKRLKEVKEEGIEKGIEEGKIEGFKEGIEKGIEEGKMEIIKGMISLGMDNETIVKASGLSIEKIEEIRKTVDSRES